MSKKTRYVLGRVAAAVALVTASSLASAANCSASYCFVDGTLKLSNTGDFATYQDLYGITLTSVSGSTTKLGNGPLDSSGYVLTTTTSPVTSVSFNQQGNISAAWLTGSGIQFIRGSKIVSAKNLSVRLQSAPNVVSINSDLQGLGGPILNIPTFWNLTGDGSNLISYNNPINADGTYLQSEVIGGGAISSTKEADGYYHARTKVTAIGFIGYGIAGSKQSPWSTAYIAHSMLA